MASTEPAEPRRTGVFDARQAETLLQADTLHWWFTSKASIVNELISRFGPSPGYLVDVGAGAGGVTRQLSWERSRVIAVEGNDVLARQSKGLGTSSVMASPDALPFADGTIAAITLLDVLEHLPQPTSALREACRVLQPGGLVVVTAPGHAWLWSGADDVLGHLRRYTRARQRQELVGSGFEVRFCSHIFSWLVAPLWLYRRRVQEAEAQLGLQASSPMLGRVARVLTGLELRLICRLSLPIGSSVAAIGRKPDRA